MKQEEILKLAMKLYYIKDKRVNGFIQIVYKETNKVVKKTKTGVAAARWVIKEVRKRNENDEVKGGEK